METQCGGVDVRGVKKWKIPSRHFPTNNIGEGTRLRGRRMRMNETDNRESWINLKPKEEQKKSEFVFLQIDITCPSLESELKYFQRGVRQPLSNLFGTFVSISFHNGR